MTSRHKIRRLLTGAAFSILTASTVATSASASDATLAGRASVIDGDTIEIQGERIRLHGIDAPESSQWCEDGAGDRYRCGRDAAFYLDDILQGKTVECDGRTRDRYDRLIAVCFFASGGDWIDINATIVNAGHALAYRRYSTDYVSQEQAAEAAGRGMWQGPFEAPWDWRRANR
ncbi:MAG: thermonuclease family protein [Pseudomonadota bacterium]